MTNYQSLESLAKRYPAADETDIDNLAKRYEREQQQEILEIAAIAADVSANSILNLGLEPHSDPCLPRRFACSTRTWIPTLWWG